MERNFLLKFLNMELLEVLEKSGIVLLAGVAGNGESVPDCTMELESLVEGGHSLTGVQARAEVACDGVYATAFTGQALS